MSKTLVNKKSTPTTISNKKVQKKRASKYEAKLAVNVSFEELVAISLAPKTKKTKS